MMNQSFFSAGCDYNQVNTLALLLFRDRFIDIPHLYVDGNLDALGKRLHHLTQFFFGKLQALFFDLFYDRDV